MKELNLEVGQKNIKYSRKEFDGYTHKFIVKFSVDEDFRNDRNINIYSNSGSYSKLEEFIDKNKGEKVKSFTITHRATKEDNEENNKMIDEWLLNILL